MAPPENPTFHSADAGDRVRASDHSQWDQKLEARVGGSLRSKRRNHSDSESTLRGHPREVRCGRIIEGRVERLVGGKKEDRRPWKDHQQDAILFAQAPSSADNWRYRSHIGAWNCLQKAPWHLQASYHWCMCVERKHSLGCSRQNLVSSLNKYWLSSERRHFWRLLR